MEYKSTRGGGNCSPAEAVLQGLARNGGLMVCPQASFTGFDWKGCLSLHVFGAVEKILSFFLPDFPEMGSLVTSAYVGKFDTPDLTPLVPVGPFHVLELFHGPTSAFKDVALSILPQLMTSAMHLLGRTEKIVILTATSGDTGKAALEGFHDVPGTGIVVFYPDGGVSTVQKTQMVSQVGDNVTVCAVKGNFDDCQRSVKKAFLAFRDRPVPGVSFSSANSINIGRLAPQVTYYFLAYRSLLESRRISIGDLVDFVVPTGNFGNILAGYYARLMGLPVGKLVCASNENDVLYDFLTTGEYNRVRPFHRTISPSMDILVSSNLERLLYYASGENTAEMAGYMSLLDSVGRYSVHPETMDRIRRVFQPARCSEKETLEEIRHVFRDFGYLCDTHTAVAFHAAEAFASTAPVVVLSTASPFKFPAAVLRAIEGSACGDEYSLMERLSGLSGVPVPPHLLRLKNAPVLHTACIAPEDIPDYIRSLATKGEL